MKETINTNIPAPFQNRMNLILNYLVLCFAFVLPLSRSGISLFIILIFLFWILEGNWKNKWQILKKNLFFLAIFGYVGFVLLSLLWTQNYSEAIPNIKNYFHLVLVPVFLTSVRPHFQSLILKAFAGGVLILILLSVLNYNRILTIFGSAGYANLFMHHLDFSMFLAWSALLSLYLLWIKIDKLSISTLKENWLWTLVFLSSLTWIFFQTGRVGQVAFILVTPVLVYYLMKKKYFKYYWAAVVILALALVAEFYGNYNFQKRVQDAGEDIGKVFRGDYDTSIGVRVLTIKLVMPLLQKSPLVGYGVGDNMDVYRTWLMSVPTSPSQLEVIKKTHFHNQYLQILTETGLIGLVLFLSLFYFFYKGAAWRVPTICLILLFLTGFVAEPFFRNQFASALIALFLGLLYIHGDEIPENNNLKISSEKTEN